MSWILHFFGVEPRSPSTAYNFWSGFGSDLGELAIIGAIFGTWHRHTCHVQGCLRISRQQIQGTTLHVCRKHHPDDAPTAEQLTP